jgi:hypothetical protein
MDDGVRIATTGRHIGDEAVDRLGWMVLVSAAD